MEIGNFYVGQSIKNYKEFCKLAREDEKKGKQRETQVQSWKRYMNFEKDGHKFIITEIYKTPFEKVDRRRGSKRRGKHGLSNHRLYGIWSGMKDRCFNENLSVYIHYGGRGISICDEWLDRNKGFMNFYNWAINNGYSDKLSIDRINVNGNYEPDNCRWATMKEQSNNKRNNVNKNSVDRFLEFKRNDLINYIIELEKRIEMERGESQ